MRCRQTPHGDGESSPLPIDGRGDEHAVGEVVLAVSLADGADAFVLRATPAIEGHHSSRPVAAQVAAGVEADLQQPCHMAGDLKVAHPRRATREQVADQGHRDGEVVHERWLRSR
mgnify:CR=1 FL=1